MDNLEEALRNIDVFCRVLVEKMMEKEGESERNIAPEPIENLLRKKYIIEEGLESNPLTKHIIPLPQLEEPLIDVFEDNDYVRVLVQCRCREQKVTIHTDVDGMEICKKECHNEDGKEICVDKCQKLDVPVRLLRIEEMMAKCHNNEVLEVTIPKVKNP